MTLSIIIKLSHEADSILIKNVKIATPLVLCIEIEERSCDLFTASSIMKIVIVAIQRNRRLLQGPVVKEKKAKC